VPEEAQALKEVARELNGVPAGRTIVSNVLAPLARYWWVELLLGAIWLVAAVVVLKFNHASVVTIGVLTGILFLVFAAEEFAFAALDDRPTRWLWALFGCLLTVGGVVALINPQSTFAGLAEILGFVFLLVGIMWTVQAFTEQAFNPMWWLTLVSGILMVVLSFWTIGEFFVERAYTLLIFAGVWALMKGITDVVRAFQMRELAG
jgi:uncharacterized membrane protein HdeD (DUF308 family)